MIFALFMALEGACASSQAPSGGSPEEQTEALLHSDMHQLTKKLQEHWAFINEQSMGPMSMNLEFIDITLDGIPEFIWSHSDSGNSGQQWYHAYSLTKHQDISVKHLGDWQGLYYEDEDESLVLFSATTFEGRYYIDQAGQRYYFAHRTSGVVVPTVDYHRLWHDKDGWKVESKFVPKSEFQLPDDKSYPLAIARKELDMKNIEDSVYSCLTEYFSKNK